MSCRLLSHKGSIVMIVLLLVVSVPAQAAWWWPFGDKGIAYQVKIKGIDKPTKEWVEKLKLDQPNTDHLPQNKDELAQEAVSLGERLRKAMEAKGYYDAVISQKTDDTAKPIVLRYDVLPGVQYRIQTIRLEWPNKPLRKIGTENLTSKTNQVVDVEKIQNDAVTLFNEIGDKACLLSLNVSPLLRLYGASRKAELVFRITHGAQANFGSTIIKGNPHIHDKVIMRSVVWKKGACYEEAKVDETRSKLVQNQLLASVNITHDDKPDALGEVPMTVTVSERVARTVTAGVNYSTDQGFGVTSGWEHRNFFGNAEKFNADLVLAEQEQSIMTNLRVPAFMRDDQVLALNAGIQREDTDVYTSDSISTGATIERRLSRHLNSGLGVGYEVTQTKDKLDKNNKYALLSFPGFLEYDTRDDAIDARKGIMGRLSLTPYTETFGDGGQFFKTQGTVQTYLSADTKLKPTLALRFSAGSITGADGVDVPSDLRFYAGGGGSVRGFSYQSLSPRLNNQPVGGSSMAVGSAEIRMRFTETLGGVVFGDAGNAYETPTPDFGEEVYYGAGIGARYYSPIGPLRVDVAFPINGKEIGETGYALYVSLGQSF